jgi:hypothetical protein
MANEITIINPLNSNPIDFEVPDSISVEKGTLMQLYTARACSGAVTIDVPIAGIAAREKIANDGRTQLACWVGPLIARGKASGAMTVGWPIKCNSDATWPNYIGVAKPAAAVSGACVIGYSLSTAADQGTFDFMFNVGSGGNVAV